MNRRANEHERPPLKGPRVRVMMPADPLTVVEARLAMAEGDSLYIRGQGDGLSWERGQRLKCGFGGSWIWTTAKARGKVRFRLLLNDSLRAKGRDVVVQAGKLVEVAPVF